MLQFARQRKSFSLPSGLVRSESRTGAKVEDSRSVKLVFEDAVAGRIAAVDPSLKRLPVLIALRDAASCVKSVRVSLRYKHARLDLPAAHSRSQSDRCRRTLPSRPP
eukprot:SAG31_NODE_692_length_12772_cov_15.543044_3_plen_107_part_00